MTDDTQNAYIVRIDATPGISSKPLTADSAVDAVEQVIDTTLDMLDRGEIRTDHRIEVYRLDGDRTDPVWRRSAVGLREYGTDPDPRGILTVEVDAEA